MFNIGPFELVVLAIVALIVLGPDRLPGFVRDAARMLKTLREMATGARQQLRDELGPEFADVDFRNLNPRTAITRAVFGDELPDLQKYHPRNFSAQSLLFGDEEKDAPERPISMSKGSTGRGSAGGDRPISMTKNTTAAPASPTPAARPRPRPQPRPPSGYESDAT